jgi:hypothetical protein
MSEFINTLNPQLSDLEAMMYLGFAKGTSKIFLDGLETLSYEKVKEEKLSEFCSILDVKL